MICMFDNFCSTYKYYYDDYTSDEIYEKFILNYLCVNKWDAVCWTEIKTLFFDWCYENNIEENPEKKEIKNYFIKKFGRKD